jgi:O-antigen/teichoic acid export membrane protein
VISSERAASAGGIAALARGGGLALLGTAVSGLLGFAFVVVVTRSMSVSEAGVLLEAVAIATVLANAFSFGADTGLVRAIARYRAQDKWPEVRAVIGVALGPVLVVSLALSAALFVAAAPLGDLIVRGEPGNAEAFLRAVAVFLPAAALMVVALSGTRAFGSMLPYVAVSNLAVPTLRIVLLAASVALGLGSVAAAISWSVPFLVGAALGLVAIVIPLRRAAVSDDRRLDAAERRLLAREFWRFTVPRGVAAFLQAVVSWIGVVLVGALHSAREAGIVAAASRYLIAGAVAIQALGLATAPLVAAALGRDDRDGAQLLYRVGAWWLVILSWPIYLTLIAFAPFLLRIFGSGFAEGQTTLAVLCVGMMVQVGTGSNKIVLLMGGRSGVNLLTSAISVVVLLGLSVALIPDHGALGGAVAWTVTFTLDNAATTFAVRRLLGLSPFGLGYLVSAAAAVCCFGLLGFAFRVALGATAAGLIAFLASAGTVYLAVIWRNRARLHMRDLLRGLRRRAALEETPLGPAT